jgi:hypothetical protein
MADTFAKRLNTLKGLPPYEALCQGWHKVRERFTMNPYHHALGLNILLRDRLERWSSLMLKGVKRLNPERDSIPASGIKIVVQPIKRMTWIER